MFIMLLCLASCDKSLNSSLNYEKYFEGYKTTKKEYSNTGKLKSVLFSDGIFYDSCYVKYYRDNGGISYLANYKNGEDFGDRLVFNENGKLQTYLFLVNSTIYTFEQEFDAEGKIISELQSPYVYSNTNFSKIRDTVEIQMIFAKIPFKELSVQISNDGKNYKKIKLLESKNYINDYEYICHQSIKNLNQIDVYLKMECKYFKNAPHVFYDTISFTRKTSILRPRQVLSPVRNGELYHTGNESKVLRSNQREHFKIRCSDIRHVLKCKHNI